MRPDPHTLLCERCGYIIEGLPAGANCSECGTPVAASLPESRTGSPWQTRRGVRPFLATSWLVIRRPARLFSSVRLDIRSGASLLAINLLMAAVTILSPLTGILLDDPIRSLRGAHAAEFIRTAIVVVPLQILAIAAVLLLLTLLEWAGIQFFARRRGARLCPLAAWQVVAHASIGWVLAALTVLFSLSLNYWVLSLFPRFSPSLSYSGLPAVIIPAIGAVAGLLIFESLVAIGVRRCRFANRPRPALA